MRVGSRIGSVARDRTTWLVLLALTLGVVLPAACVIWFMTEAAANQADAARQRVSDALRGQLRLLRERSMPTGGHGLRRIEQSRRPRGAGRSSGWSPPVRSIRSCSPPARASLAIRRSLPLSVHGGATTTRSNGGLASALEAYGSHAAAAQEYATHRRSDSTVGFRRASRTGAGARAAQGRRYDRRPRGDRALLLNAEVCRRSRSAWPADCR